MVKFWLRLQVSIWIDGFSFRLNCIVQMLEIRLFNKNKTSLFAQTSFLKNRKKNKKKRKGKKKKVFLCWKNIST